MFPADLSSLFPLEPSKDVTRDVSIRNRYLRVTLSGKGKTVEQMTILDANTEKLLFERKNITEKAANNAWREFLNNLQKL